MDSYYVYEHKNIINGKRYIGITKQNPEQRWGVGGINYKHSCPRFWNAIKKYGWNNFSHTVLFDGLTKEEACKKEIQLIAKYKTQSKEYGYNIMEGGTTASMPQEVRQHLSVALMGNQNGKGHPCSDEKRLKISLAQKGRHLTEDHKRKLSEAKRGRHHASPTEETKKKISDAHAKTPVFCEENGITYQSIQQCAKSLNLIPTLVCKCCKGKLKTTGGYHLSYV